MIPQNDSSDTRNLIVAGILCVLVLVGYQKFFAVPPPPPAPAVTTVNQGDAVTPGAVPNTLEAGMQAGALATGGLEELLAPDEIISRVDLLAKSKRIPIETDTVIGSIQLKGGLLDDLSLRDYKETLDADAGIIHLLNPTGLTPEKGNTPYFVAYGWIPAGKIAAPGPSTDWSLESGTVLSEGSPITLVWDNGAGLTFRRECSIDNKYLIEITQSVKNTSGNPVTLAPYGYIARIGRPDTQKFFILHEGAIGDFDGVLTEHDYGDLEDLDPIASEGGPTEITTIEQDGWLGFTDKYWMTAIAPVSGQAFDAVFKAQKTSKQIAYLAQARLPAITVESGASTSVTTDLFAGAKEYRTISDYQNQGGINKFIESIDWGMFFFLTKPMFKLLMFIQGFIGNMGWSIILLTFTVKAVLFPLAYKSYVSMGKMKKLQPEMEKLKADAGDDKQKLQKSMIALYKKEKVNPAHGASRWLQTVLYRVRRKLGFATKSASTPPPD